VSEEVGKEVEKLEIKMAELPEIEVNTVSLDEDIVKVIDDNFDDFVSEAPIQVETKTGAQILEAMDNIAVPEELIEGLKDVVEGNVKPAAEVDSVFDGWEHDGIVLDEAEKIENVSRILQKIREFDDSFEITKSTSIKYFENLILHGTSVCNENDILPGQKVCIRKRASKMIKLVAMLEDIE